MGAWLTDGSQTVGRWSANLRVVTLAVARTVWWICVRRLSKCCCLATRSSSTSSSSTLASSSCVRAPLRQEEFEPPPLLGTAQRHKGRANTSKCVTSFVSWASSTAAPPQRRTLTSAVVGSRVKAVVACDADEHGDGNPDVLL